MRERTTLSIRANTLKRAADVIKCLGHPLRLRLLEALEAGPKSVSELQAHAGVPQATVSHQLGVLRSRNIVASRRAGTHVFYRIIEPKVNAVLECIRQSQTTDPE